jgi:hypothetical protein
MARHPVLVHGKLVYTATKRNATLGSTIDDTDTDTDNDTGSWARYRKWRWSYHGTDTLSTIQHTLLHILLERCRDWNIYRVWSGPDVLTGLGTEMAAPDSFGSGRKRHLHAGNNNTNHTNNNDGPSKVWLRRDDSIEISSWSPFSYCDIPIQRLPTAIAHRRRLPLLYLTMDIIITARTWYGSTQQPQGAEIAVNTENANTAVNSREYRPHRRRTSLSSSNHNSLNLHAVWDDSTDIIETILQHDFQDSRNAFEVSLLLYIHDIRTVNIQLCLVARQWRNQNFNAFRLGGKSRLI